MAASDVIQKDLGLVTAYGYALAGGYKGTEEEFKEALAALLIGQYASGNANGDASHIAACAIYKDEDGTRVKYGVIGSGGWAGCSADIGGIRIDIEYGVDYIDFGRKWSEDSSSYMSAMCYVSNSADEQWADEKGFIRNEWNMGAPINMRNFPIHNVSTIGDGVSGTFTSADGKTVTVSGGIITGIN